MYALTARAHDVHCMLSFGQMPDLRAGGLVDSVLLRSGTVAAVAIAAVIIISVSRVWASGLCRVCAMQTAFHFETLFGLLCTCKSTS